MNIHDIVLYMIRKEGVFITTYSDVSIVRSGFLVVGALGLA